MEILYFLIAAMVVALLAGIAIYNALVLLRQKTKEAWSGITVQLKKRHDLIPNLVQTVKGYAAHESQTLENVIKARQQAIDISGIENLSALPQAAELENMLTQTLKSLFALSESYPDLKASQNFLDLQAQIREIEEQISASRRIYNSNSQMYNTKREMFPSNIVASLFSFEKAEYFDVDESEKKVIQKAPKVEF